MINIERVDFYFGGYKNLVLSKNNYLGKNFVITGDSVPSIIAAFPLVKKMHECCPRALPFPSFAFTVF